jgi:DNA-binding beta-propeller fold protein YncE
MNKSRWKRASGLLALVSLIVMSCTEQASQPGDNDPVETLDRGVYILCEGLWKMDNATLTRYNPGTGKVENDFFRRANPGLRLGDTGNDIVLKGDTAFVTVTTSRAIEVFQVSTGKWIQRLRLGDRQPRCLALAPDGMYVSNYTDNSISRFDPATFTMLTERIPVGPAAEGIAYARGFIFAANSGLGSLQIDSPHAGTLSVIRMGMSSEEKKLQAAPNISELLVSPDGSKLYAISHEVAGRPELVPTLIEYNVASLMETRRWQFPSITSPCLSSGGDSLFFISSNGVDILDLRMVGSVGARTVVTKDRMDDRWYSLAVHPQDGTLWIGNARGYTTEGEVIIADRAGQYIKRFDVGINPTAIVFFGYK